MSTKPRMEDTPRTEAAQHELPILHETCTACDGAGMVENAEEFGRFWEEHGKDCDPVGFRTCERCRYAPREEVPCPDCEGRQSTLTEAGRGLIDFLLRFGFIRESHLTTANPGLILFFGLWLTEKLLHRS